MQYDSRTHEHVSRRSVVTGAAGIVSACTPRPRRPAVHKVSLSRATTYGPGLYSTVLEILREHKLDVRGKRVLLKPNLVEYEDHAVINTHPLLVHATYEAVRALGAAEVRIGEGPGHRRETLELCERAGFFQLDPRFENAFVDLNVDEVSRVTLQHPASRLREIYLPNTALAADLLISIPKMKTHHWAGATLSMKNLFGVVPGGIYGWPKNVLHWAGIDECIVDLYRVFPKHFCIVDGIDGMEGNGPIQGTRKHAGVIVAGGDMASVDALCCRVMGIDPARIKYLAKANPGALHPSAMDLLGVELAEVYTPFALMPEWQHIRAAGA